MASSHHVFYEGSTISNNPKPVDQNFLLFSYDSYSLYLSHSVEFCFLLDPTRMRDSTLPSSRRLFICTAEYRLPLRRSPLRLEPLRAQEFTFITCAVQRIF